MSADGDKLFVGTGTVVHVVRPATLTTETQWTVTSSVRGLAVSGNGARLWVGQTDGAVALDASSGREVATLPIHGLTAIGHAAV